MPLLATDCIPMYEGLVAAGSKSLFQSPLYSDVLVKPMANSLSSVQFQPLNDSTPPLEKMKAAIEDFKPGATIWSDVADRLLRGRHAHPVDQGRAEGRKADHA